MLIEVMRQSGRGFNLVYLRALQGAGDIRYTIVIGILSMWLLVVGGGYVLGCALGWGLCGIWLAKALDEIIRGCIFRRRWGSGIWKRYTLVQSDSK
jgi:Na+-driven multidrug efflux pump